VLDLKILKWEENAKQRPVAHVEVAAD